MLTHCSEIFGLIDANNKSEIMRMIESGTGECLNELNSKKQTPLHYAIDKLRPKIARMLIDAGARLNLQDQSGKVPLYFAVYNNYSYLVKYLLERGANPNIPDNVGWTPLMVEVANYNPSSEIVTQLIQAGADINLRETQGKSAVDLLIINYGDYYDTYKKRMKFFELKNNEKEKGKVFNELRSLMLIIYQLMELSIIEEESFSDNPKIMEINNTNARDSLQSFLKLKELQLENTLLSVIPKDLLGLIYENLI